MTTVLYSFWTPALHICYFQEGEVDIGDTGDEDSDSDLVDFSTNTLTMSDASSHESIPLSYQLNLKYNSVYRNSGNL